MKELIETLKQAFPYGHPEFIPLLVEKAKLHSDKNHDYAKGGTPLGNFERVATIFGQYPGLKLDDPVVVMLAYAMKQIDAVLWGFAQGIEHKVEGPIDRLSDVLVYSGIAICALKDRAAQAEFDKAILAPAKLNDAVLKQEPEVDVWTCPDCGARVDNSGLLPLGAKWEPCGKKPYVKAA